MTSPPTARHRPSWSFVLMTTFTAFACSVFREVPPTISECRAEAWPGHIFPIASFVLLVKSASPAIKNLIREWCCGSSWNWEERRPAVRVSRDSRREKSVPFLMSSCIIRSLKRTAVLAESRKALSSSLCWSRTFKRDSSKWSTSWIICSTCSFTICIARVPACRMSTRASSARLASSLDTWSMAWRESSSFRLSLSNLSTFSATSRFRSSTMSPRIEACTLMVAMITDRSAVTTNGHVARLAVELQLVITVLRTLRNDVFNIDTLSLEHSCFAKLSRTAYTSRISKSLSEDVIWAHRHVKLVEKAKSLIPALLHVDNIDPAQSRSTHFDRRWSDILTGWRVIFDCFFSFLEKLFTEPFLLFINRRFRKRWRRTQILQFCGDDRLIRREWRLN